MHRAGYISHTAASGIELDDLRIFKKGLTAEEVQDLTTSLLSNLTANTLSKKLESATNYVSPKSPEIKQKMQQIQIKYPQKAGGIPNPKAQNHPAMKKAQNDLKKVQGKEATVNAMRNESVKTVVKETTEKISGRVAEKWGEWENTGRTEKDGLYSIYERKSESGNVETKRVLTS